ncbi:MAG: cyclic nucleotide-binding domain-containing protein [Deltaproteobacteria bacterium]|nr:cyclic nucleotide-binding domain-containing protein [Deltaproteobacteria bacterium]
MNSDRKNQHCAADTNHLSRNPLENKEKNLRSQINLARTQLSQGKKQEGLETYFKIAAEMVLIAEVSKATAIYKLILKEEPANPMALAFLSTLYHNQGLDAEVLQLNTRENNKSSVTENLPAELQQLLIYALRPLFFTESSPEPARLSQIAQIFKISKFSPGELILKEGENNQTLYVILDGKIKISCGNREATGEIPITTLAAGDFFGEFSLLTGETASADVRAQTAGWLASVKRQEVDRLAVHFPEFLPRILESFRIRKQRLLIQKINGYASGTAADSSGEGLD